MRGTALALVLVLPLGARPAAPRIADTGQLVGALDALIEVYGPGPGVGFDYYFFSHDLNGDAIAETIVTLQRQERGMDPPDQPLGVGSSVHCDGFAVFTVAARQEWPVFYVYNVYDGFSIRLEHVDGDPNPSVVCDTDNGGRQLIWGWYDYSEIGCRWRARYKTWDDGIQKFALPSRPMDYIYVNEGK